METSYFLGANSAAGFCSLYDGFGRSKGDFLRIIKGGPGTGKSGFMRAIAREALRRGLDVETVLCSGDPDSLDGLYIPALGLAYCDGTAPHSAEPAAFGVDSDYVNIGQFCRTPLGGAQQERVLTLSAAYRAKYARAYALLKAGYELEKALAPQTFAQEHAARAGDVLRAVCDRLLPPSDEKGSLIRRFSGAISCQGVLQRMDGVELCKLIYCCEDGCGLAAAALADARDEALQRGARVIEYVSPFDARSVDALLLPELKVCFVRGTPGVAGAKRIALDRLCGELSQVKERRRELRAARRESARCVEAACGQLAEAKALHDELESVYRPSMDFPALDAFTAREIARVFA